MAIEALKIKAQKLKKEIDALYLCSKDPRVPWYAKVFAFLILGYALSPIDLIPDFIPVIGYLDDVILVPLGIVCLKKMIPQDVLDECREKAKDRRISKGNHWIAASVIIMIWVLIVFITIRSLWHYFNLSPPVHDARRPAVLRAVAGQRGVVRKGKAEVLADLPVQPCANGRTVPPGAVSPDTEGGKRIAGKRGIERVVAADKLMKPPDPELRGEGTALRLKLLLQPDSEGTDQ